MTWLPQHALLWLSQKQMQSCLTNIHSFRILLQWSFSLPLLWPCLMQSFTGLPPLSYQTACLHFLSAPYLSSLIHHQQVNIAISSLVKTFRQALSCFVPAALHAWNQPSINIHKASSLFSFKSSSLAYLFHHSYQQQNTWHQLDCWCVMHTDQRYFVVSLWSSVTLYPSVVSCRRLFSTLD